MGSAAGAAGEGNRYSSCEIVELVLGDSMTSVPILTIMSRRFDVAGKGDAASPHIERRKVNAGKYLIR